MDRFISGYKNRIIQKQDIKKVPDFKNLCKNNFNLINPNINTFVENFEFYYQNFKLTQHFRPQYLFSSEKQMLLRNYI